MNEQERVQSFISQLSDQDIDKRWQAANGLGLLTLGGDAAKAVLALIRTLKDDDPRVRWNAAWALGRIGKKAVAAVPALIQALKDPNWEVRLRAENALGRFGEKAIAGIISAVAKGELSREQTQSIVLEVLRQIKQSGIQTGVRQNPRNPHAGRALASATRQAA